MRIHHLTRELAAIGYEVHIYTMQWWEGGSTYLQDGITFHAISRLYPLYNGERRSIVQGILFGIACLKLFRYDFDVLDVDQMPFFPLYAAKLVSIVRRKPLYATWHEVWGREYWQEYLPGIKGRIAAMIETLSVRLPTHIIAVSDHTADRLRTGLNYHGPLSMVTNGIDYLQIAPVKPATYTSDIIFAGRLLAHKNVDMLLRAIAIVRQQQPNLRCVIVGDGPEAAKLQKLIITLDLGKTVRMTGFVETSDEVFSYMKSSKVFVLPSVREGFGITVLEAYACGLSIVTVNHPDNAAQYIAPKEASIICEPAVTDLANAIQRQLVSRKRSTHTTNPAQYDWSALAGALREVYPS
jgi:glycosyltransferase involved in cell wall biosynthesis